MCCDLHKLIKCFDQDLGTAVVYCCVRFAGGHIYCKDTIVQTIYLCNSGSALVSCTVFIYDNSKPLRQRFEWRGESMLHCVCCASIEEIQILWFYNSHISLAPS